jgi:uncharacterized protein
MSRMAFPASARRFTRRDVLKGAAAACVGVAAGMGAHGFLYERHRIEVTRATLAVSGLPESLSGLRVGFLTDIHRSATVSHELIARAVDLLSAEATDLIILGGDYVSFNDRSYAEPAADVLAPLSAPFGVFGVVGNHDDDREVPAALAKRGVEMLMDARTRISVRGEALDLIGIRYWTRKIADIAKLARGATAASIFISHTPMRLTEAAALGLPLMLSGHTHGGQVVLPVLGPIAASGFPIIAGEGHRENTTGFVSRGVGTVYVPVRVHCPPEVAVLTLRPSEIA